MIDHIELWREDKWSDVRKHKGNISNASSYETGL